MQQMDSPSTSDGRRPISPYIKITEQPFSKGLRFRYECEGRSAGSILGVNSTKKHKTYPTIQIVGFKGRAIIVVSCVSKDKPFCAHPYSLVGQDCNRGICTIEIKNDTMTASFQHLGVQCVKKKDIDDALKVREEIQVDPFRNGFSHKDNPSSIDLSTVRLCFQAFLGCSQKGKYRILEPVVSGPIYDKKAMSDLVICKLSDISAPADGGKDIILLCEKVQKDDIQVRFFEERDGSCIWEDYAEFQPSDVHKQVAISFKVPQYKTLQIDHPVYVLMQLKRLTDGMCSEARPFIFTPVEPALKRKIPKFNSESDILRQFNVFDPTHIPQPQISIDKGNLKTVPIPSIKEVPDTTLNSYGDLYSLQNPNVLAQHQIMYNSRAPTPSKYKFPSQVYLNEQPSTNINVAQPLSGNNKTSGCFTTQICPTLNNQIASSSAISDPPTPLTMTTSFPYPSYGNGSNLMDEFACLDHIDSNDLDVYCEDIAMIEDNDQQSLPATVLDGPALSR